MNEHTKSNTKDWLQLAHKVLDIEIQGIKTVRDGLGAEYIQALEVLAACKGRVVVSGVGKSGLVGRKIAATFSSTGTPAYFLHPVEGAHGDMGLIRDGDVVLAISNSGETEELNTILPTLNSLGSICIGLTGNLKSTMADLCRINICTKVPQEACTLGLAPTASTTATLAIGDALAVGLLEWKSFGKEDFRKYHPGGELGRQLRLEISKIMHTLNIPVVQCGTSLLHALQTLDQGGLGTICVVDKEHRLKGIMTDGDIRRMLCHKNFSLQAPIDHYMTSNPKYASLGQKGGEILDIMEKSAITVLPVINSEHVLQGIVHLHDLLGKGKFRFFNNHSNNLSDDK